MAQPFSTHQGWLNFSSTRNVQKYFNYMTDALLTHSNVLASPSGFILFGFCRSIERLLLLYFFFLANCVVIVSTEEGLSISMASEEI